MGWCERCEQEREGLICPVCGGQLLQEIIPEELDPADPAWALGRGPEPAWPLLPDGRPEPEVLLERAPDFESYAGLTLSRLAAAGIPARVDAGQRGGVCRLFGGFSPTGVDICVPAGRLEEAKRLLRPMDAAGEQSNEEEVP